MLKTHQEILTYLKHMRFPRPVRALLPPASSLADSFSIPSFCCLSLEAFIKKDQASLPQ